MDIAKMIEGKTPEEIKALLESNADHIVDDETFFSRWNEEQLAQANSNFTKNAMLLVEKEQEFDAYKKAKGAEIKGDKIAQAELLGDIKAGGTFIEGTQYLIKDEENMYTYNELGTLLGSRRLKPGEKQRTVFHAIRNENGIQPEGGAPEDKTGTNN